MRSICVVILGTDGAGKTSIIQNLENVDFGCGINGIIYEHLRPNLLPPIAQLLGAKGAKENIGVPNENPHGQPPSGKLGSIFRTLYYAVDYIIGYWLKAYPRLRSEKKVSVFDRYFYDFIIDPRRMRVSLPRPFIKWAFVLAPKPDLVIGLGADPQILFDRKPETSIEEVTRHVNELKSLCDKHCNGVWVDTGQELSSSTQEVIEAISQAIKKRS